MTYVKIRTVTTLKWCIINTTTFIYNEGDKIYMGYLHIFIIGTLIFGALIVVSCTATDNEGYLQSSVDYPDQIEPADKVFYPSNAHAGESTTFTNTQTPEPDDQEDGYSEDNEDLESA